MGNVWIRQIRRAAGLNRPVKLFLIMIAISGFGNGIFQLFLNFFVLARGNDKAFLGLLMSLVSLAALVLGLPMGLLSDAFGRRRALLLGTLLSTGAIAVLLLAPANWPLLLAAVGLGAGNALFMAAGPAFVSAHATEEERPLAFSLQFSLRMLVAFAGSLVGGLLPAWFAGLLHAGPESLPAYRATLLVAWAIMGLAIIPLLMIRETPHPAGETARRSSFSLRSLPLRRDMFLLAAPQLIIALGAGMLIPYLNIFLKERFGIADSLLGTVFAVYQLLIGVGTLVAPVLAERWGEVRTIVSTQLASLPFLMALGFVPLLPVAIVALWLRAMLMNMGNPIYTSFAMRQVQEQERGTAGAMLGTAWSVGQMVGPGISGVVQQSVGFTPLFLATGSTYLIASLLLRTLFPDADRTEAVGPFTAQGDDQPAPLGNPSNGEKGTTTE